MCSEGRARVAYVVKRYPVYSETFIVNELLAHEASGLELEIFALYHTNDQHFQDAISRVRARVTYLAVEGLRALEFWSLLETAAAALPGFWARLEAARGLDGREVYQAAQLALIARQRGITHLHAHFASTATGVARLAASLAGITYSFTAHAKDIFHDEVKPEMLERKLADAKSVVTVSEFNLAFLRQAYGEAAAGVRRVYNGLDLERFGFARPEVRPRLLVSVGRLVEKKGFPDLLEACAVLKARGVAFCCVIVGTGPLEAALRQEVTRLGLLEEVRLLGPRPQPEIIELVQGASAFVAPCVVAADGNRDGLPTVLLEAMALGTPCVSTDVTGIPEVIRGGPAPTGVLVAQRDPLALADACQRLLEDATWRVQLAQNARALIETEFDVNRNAARLREAFGLETPRPELARLETTVTGPPAPVGVS